MEKCLIVAVSDNGAIGVNGDLPWHIREDLRYFKQTTSGYPVIMGRTTFESIGRPLPGRTNIVLSTRNLDIPGIVCVHSLEEAFAAAGDAEKCFVMGGASVYAKTLDMVEKLYVTHVHTIIEGADAYFPEINYDIWGLQSRSETFTDPETGYNFEFVVYSRR